MFSVVFWLVLIIVVLKLNASDYNRTTRYLINAIFYLPKEVCENIKHISNNFKRDYGQRRGNQIN
ncbi:hypothetical protein [Acetilactobacillus jinshanensis]|uniref:Uncharacterized protein n=1 Tax=Acetilactobacillus jinshanensis TaxID=1720083 RepID=A0A4P6ZLE2_9LACO|nr:hypothetical protein [Acetilactobacillus jinshanensis]QBP18060.1 hypothetical protein ELX58_02620 [Acetilactobacillus jinshanensis]